MKISLCNTRQTEKNKKKGGIENNAAAWHIVVSIEVAHIFVDFTY